MTSNLETMMHLLKGNIGTGILAMPNAFGNAGLLVGSILLPIMGVIAVHCMHMLVNSNDYIQQKLGLNGLPYEDVTKYAIQSGPLWIKDYWKAGKSTVIAFLMITQFGFCAAYCLFVADSVHNVVNTLTDGEWNISMYMALLIELPFMIAFCCIRNLRHLSIGSTMANILQTIGLGIIFYNLVQDLPPTSSRPYVVSMERWPLYFGTTIYAFEGIGIVLPLKKAMKEPNAFKGYFGVLNTGMVIVASLYLGMGFFGFLKYGEKVMDFGSITLNLPSTPLFQTVKLMFALAIFLSFGIQFYVPIQIIWPCIVDRFMLDIKSSRTTMLEYMFRAMLVTLVFIVAGCVPKLDLFISLVGALSSSSLALIIPPLIDMLCNYNNDDITKRKWYFLVTKNICITIFGLIGFATGTYISLINLAKEMF